MPTVFDSLDTAVSFTTLAGKTFNDVLTEAKKQIPNITWQQLAQYNWATDKPIEVNRALAETVGCSLIDDADPLKTKLDPTLGPTGSKKILLPKLLKLEDLELEKTHTIKLGATKPSTAVRITKLSRWFIPGNEDCDLEYQLEGLGAHATTVECIVHGSNYCEASGWNKGFGTYTAKKDDFVFKQPQDDQAEERKKYNLRYKNKANEWKPWKGEANATAGMLKLTRDENTPRHINVAFSPYTVVLRYFKDQADKDARIELTPFWPTFDNLGAVEATSLAIKWKLRDAANLASYDPRGLLVIVDGSDKEVYRKALDKSLLPNDTEKSFSWDGAYAASVKNSKDGAVAIADDMPYRVQIQVHSGPDQVKGLALAAMHTEIRLYVHKDTKKHDAEDYDAWSEKQSLDLSLAQLYLGDAAPTDNNKKEWAQYKLAEAGFHCGPVDGKDRDDLTYGLKEFQRSVPQHKTGTSYLRQTPAGTISGETKTALANLPDNWRRTWFGNPDAGNADLPQKSEEEQKTISTRLNDPTKKMSVWLEWRQYYTESTGEQASVTLDNYRGDMDIGDTMVSDDESILVRPWIPVRCQPRLLSKTKKLSDVVTAETDKDKRAQLLSAIGPLRIDWIYYEPDMDLSVIATAPHKKERVRTKAYVKWAIEKFKKQYEHKNPKRNVTATNCIIDQGGIRHKTTTAAYYKAPYGCEDDKRLAPWHSHPDDTSQTVVTVVHDQLVAGQPKDTEPLDKKNVGAAGIFFRPSVIAGDGYRLRARVNFDKLAGQYEMPNLEVLKKRYQQLPQACSAELRVWRKSSMRAVVNWGGNDSHFADVRSLYKACHVHFVHELGSAGAYVPTDLVAGNVAEDVVKEIIKDKSSQQCSKDKTRMSFSDTNVWPWYNDDKLGWDWASPPDIPYGEVKEKLIDDCVDDTWEKFQEKLLYHLVKRIEAKDGRLRGHVLVPFKDSSNRYTRRYKCQSCGKKFWYLQKLGGASAPHAGRKCEDCNEQGAKGIQLDGKCQGRYQCTTCNGPICTTPDNDEWYPNAGKYVGGDGGCNHYALAVVGTNQTAAPSAARQFSMIIDSGIGMAQGSIWVVKGMEGWEWAHEVGHNRHLEHAADAPGAVDAQHDAQTNTHGGAGFDGSEVAKNKRWDRACVMSYVDLSDYHDAVEDQAYFCGKCVLRGRGWKVQNFAGGPGTAVTVA